MTHSDAKPFPQDHNKNGLMWTFLILGIPAMIMFSFWINGFLGF